MTVLCMLSPTCCHGDHQVIRPMQHLVIYTTICRKQTLICIAQEHQLISHSVTFVISTQISVSIITFSKFETQKKNYLCSCILWLQTKNTNQKLQPLKMAEVRKLTMTYKIISAFSLTSWSKSILQYPPTSHYIHGLGCLFFFSFYSWAGKSSPISKFSSQKCGPAVYEAQKNVGGGPAPCYL